MLTPREELTRLTEVLFSLHSHLTVWKNLSAVETGLSPLQLNVIEVLGHNYSLGIKEVAEKLGVTPGSLSVMINRLEKKELVKCKPSEQDRRSVRIFLTDRGKKVFLARYKQQLEFINNKIKSLNKNDRENITSSFGIMLSLIRNENT